MSKRWLIILYVAALLWWFRRELPPYAPTVRGRVESVGPMTWPYEGIRCTVWDGSEGHAGELQIQNGLYHVGMDSRTQVWDYSAGSGEVQVGQTISIWFNGMAKTHPPHVYPHTVVIEPPVWLHFVVFGTLTLALLIGLGGLTRFRRTQQWLGAPHD